MNEFACILVPLDGSPRSEAVLPWVRLLPAREIRLLRACANEAGRQDAAGYLAGIAQGLEAAARIETEVVVGAPAEAIVAAAREASLIAMCTQGAGGGGRLVYGSVADRVARHAPAPTLLLRDGSDPTATGTVRRVVVPLDGSTTAERALPMAETLARIVGAPLHLVTVIEPGPDQLCDAAQAVLDDLANRMPQDSFLITTESRAGDPVTELVAAIGPGDVVVATTHGKGTARRWQIGHVADQLLRQAPAPVLLIRADDEV